MVFNPQWLTGIGALLGGVGDLFTEQPDPELMSPEQKYYEQARYKAGQMQWMRQLLGEEPKFGFVSTQTPEQQQILSQLMGVQPGAEERAGVLSRLMAVSPEEETAAIRAMSEPAMRQYREEILPATRQPFHAAGTTWSTMRAREEAKRGVDLSERLARLGEQYRMERRGQALTATGQSAAEALGRQGVLSGILGMDLQDYYTYGQYEALSPAEQQEVLNRLGLGKWEEWGNGGYDQPNGNGDGDEPPEPPEPPPLPPDYWSPTYDRPWTPYTPDEPVLPPRSPQEGPPRPEYEELRKRAQAPTLSQYFGGGWE